MPAAAGVSPWATWAGRAVHVLLYGVMLAQPITGIVFMQAGGKEVGMMGWHLPRLVDDDKELHAQLKEAHQLIGTLFYGLLAMHVTAALWHHVLLRNPTLHRMLPWLPMRASKAPAESAAPAGSTTTVVVEGRRSTPDTAPVGTPDNTPASAGSTASAERARRADVDH